MPDRVSGQDFIVTITNKVSAFPNFTFDVYVQTPSGTAYIGKSDFHFTFNTNYLTNHTLPSYQMGNTIGDIALSSQGVMVVNVGVAGKSILNQIGIESSIK